MTTFTLEEGLAINIADAKHDFKSIKGDKLIKTVESISPMPLKKDKTRKGFNVSDKPTGIYSELINNEDLMLASEFFQQPKPTAAGGDPSAAFKTTIDGKSAKFKQIKLNIGMEKFDKSEQKYLWTRSKINTVSSGGTVAFTEPEVPLHADYNIVLFSKSKYAYVQNKCSVCSNQSVTVPDQIKQLNTKLGLVGGVDTIPNIDELCQHCGGFQKNLEMSKSIDTKAEDIYKQIKGKLNKAAIDKLKIMEDDKKDTHIFVLSILAKHLDKEKSSYYNLVVDPTRSMDKFSIVDNAKIEALYNALKYCLIFSSTRKSEIDAILTSNNVDNKQNINIICDVQLNAFRDLKNTSAVGTDRTYFWLQNTQTMLDPAGKTTAHTDTGKNAGFDLAESNFRFAYETLDKTFYGYNTWPLKAGTEAESKDYAPKTIAYDTMLSNNNTCFMFPVNKDKIKDPASNNYQDYDTVFYMEVLDKNGKSQTPKAYAYANSDISKINSSNKSNNSDYKKICQKEFESRFSKSDSNNSIFKKLFNKIKNNAKYNIENPSLQHHVQAKKFGDGAQALRCVQGSTNIGLINTDREGVGNSSSGLGYSKLLDASQGQGVLKTSGYNMFVSHDRIAILQSLKFKADLVLLEQKYGGVLFIKKSCQNSSTKVKNLISYIDLYKKHKVEVPQNDPVIINFTYIYDNAETKKTIDDSYTNGVLQYIGTINKDLILRLKVLNEYNDSDASKSKCFTYCKRWKYIYKNVHEIEPSTIRKPNSGVSMLVVYEEIYKHFLLYYAIIFNLVNLYNTIQTTIYNNKYTIKILNGQLNTIIREIQTALTNMSSNLKRSPASAPALIPIVEKTIGLANPELTQEPTDITGLIEKYNKYHNIIDNVYKTLLLADATLTDMNAYLDGPGRNDAVKLSEVITEFYNFYFKLDTIFKTNRDLIVSFNGQVGHKAYLDSEVKDKMNEEIMDILTDATMILSMSERKDNGSDLWGRDATGGKCDYKIAYTKTHQKKVSDLIKELHETYQNDLNYFNFIQPYLTDNDFSIGKYGFLNRFQLFNLVPQSMMYNISKIDINSLGSKNIKLVDNISTPYNYLDKFFGIYTVLHPIMNVLTSALSTQPGAHIDNIKEILELITKGINAHGTDQDKIQLIIDDFKNEIDKIFNPHAPPACGTTTTQSPMPMGGGNGEKEINDAIYEIVEIINPNLENYSGNLKPSQEGNVVSVSPVKSGIYNYIRNKQIPYILKLYKFILNYYNELENIKSYYNSNADKYIEDSSNIQILFKDKEGPREPLNINNIIEGLEVYFTNINQISSVSVYGVLKDFFGFFPDKDGKIGRSDHNNLLEMICNYFNKHVAETVKDTLTETIIMKDISIDTKIDKCITWCSGNSGVTQSTTVPGIPVNSSGPAESNCRNHFIYISSLIDIIKLELIDIISYMMIHIIAINKGPKEKVPPTVMDDLIATIENGLPQDFYIDLDGVNDNLLKYITNNKDLIITVYNTYITRLPNSREAKLFKLFNDDLKLLAEYILNNHSKEILPLIETNIISIVEDNYGEEGEVRNRVPSMFIYDALEIQSNLSESYKDIVCIKELKNERYVNEPDYYSHYIELKGTAPDAGGPPNDGAGGPPNDGAGGPPGDGGPPDGGPPGDGGTPDKNPLLAPIAGLKRKDIYGGGKANNPLKKAFDLMTNFNKLLFKTNENGTQEIDHEKIKLLANLQYITLNNKHYYNSAGGDPTKTAAVVKGVEEKQSSGADEEIKPAGNLAKGTLAKGSQIMREMFGPAYAKLVESGSRTAGTVHRAASQLSPRLPAFPKPPVSGGKSTSSSKKTRRKRVKNKRHRFTCKKYNL